MKVKIESVRFYLPLGIAVVDGIIHKRSDELERRLADTEKWLREKYDLEKLRDEDELRAYRKFFWRMGVDPTKHRPASEALVRRTILGGLPRISPVVDSCNLASVESLVTVSAYDYKKVSPPLILRCGKEGEEANLIGGRRMKLRGGEIVLADEKRILCVYAHGDVEETKVTKATKEVLLVSYGSPGITKEKVEEALERMIYYLGKYCNGKLRFRVSV
jgi:DNA/RNA-binding domain of Phe-tRNA-synthetase-like protein